MKNIVSISSFENVSGEFMVSDPAHDCGSVLKNVKTGEWNAYVEYCSVRSSLNNDDWVKSLIVCHSSEDLGKIESLKSGRGRNIGVDSGQAGVFDKRYYADDSIFDPSQKIGIGFGNKKFYNFCCEQTLFETAAGIVPYGVVSSSGYGDGSYMCKPYYNVNDEIVMVAIRFI